MLKDKEPIDLGEWLKGHISPLRYFKDAGTLLRIVIIGLILWACVIGFVKIKTMILGSPKPETQIGAISGGTVDASANKRVKNGLNISLFGQ